MEQLDGCISFWEGILFHDRFLLDPATQYLIEATIRYLKELKAVKEKEEQWKNTN